MHVAWQLYSTDFDDKLVPNTFDANAWIDGAQWQLSGNLVTFDRGPDAATNRTWIEKGKLWKYNQSYGIYTCPADPPWPPRGARKYQRIRSFSMSGRMAGQSPPEFPTDLFDDLTTGKNPHRMFKKHSDIRNPGPSGALVFIDESEYVIDDGYFIVNAFSPNVWQNYPSSRHGGAGDMSFADGHSEIKKWRDGPLIKKNPGSCEPAPNSRDLQWLMERTSQPR